MTMGSVADTTSPNDIKPAVVCVFCGTSAGTSPTHLKAARTLAQALASNKIHLVFGGGTSGLMGQVASELVRLSGPAAVHGIIPNALMAFERKYTNAEDSVEMGLEAQKKSDESKFGRTTVVPDMHSRKKMMVDEVVSGGPGSGFVALSGGYGTMEELMEIVTWNQLGIHDKPVVLFNVDGYYDGLLQWVRQSVSEGFVAQGNAGIIAEASTARDVLLRLADYENAEGRLQLDWEE